VHEQSLVEDVHSPYEVAMYGDKPELQQAHGGFGKISQGPPEHPSDWNFDRYGMVCQNAKSNATSCWYKEYCCLCPFGSNKYCCYKCLTIISLHQLHRQ